MPKKDLITLILEPDGAKAQVRRGTKILAALTKMGFNIRSECGGREICGKCKVITQKAHDFNNITDSERERLTASELRSGYRLACACSAYENAKVQIPEESRLTTRRITVQGTERTVVVDQAIHKFYLRLPKPTLVDIRSDVQRLVDSLKDMYQVEAAKVDYELLHGLSEILRFSDWKVTVAVSDDNRIMSVEQGDTTEEIYGIAIDIGTSKIIGHLSNLITGELVQVASLENPQVTHGEDIISRISYASQSSSAMNRMQKLVIDGVNAVISEACEKSGLSSKKIYEMIVVGNTAMHHIFLGIPPRSLGLSPYVPVIKDPIDEKASNLKLKTNPSATVHVLPVIASFVGGDAVADIIATGIFESDEPSMMIDIGTNTEVVLGNKHGMITCSCASGPAFEGAHIKYGMKAVTGAIEKVEIDPESFRVTYETIGSVKPIGLCGSAVIDVVASLLKCQIIDETGRFISGHVSRRVRMFNGEKAFIVVAKTEGATRDILVTQKDIEQVLLAKAAIYVGCHTLMKKKRVKPSGIKKCHVAGAFGNYINTQNAKLIGLLPDVSIESIRFVGNAAGAGARMALISKKLRDMAVSISKKTSYIELASEPDFHFEFTSAMYLPHRDLERFPSLRNLLKV